MHVKRHFNRLFGSFRTFQKKKRMHIGVWVGAGVGPSQWELADYDLEDVTIKTVPEQQSRSKVGQEIRDPTPLTIGQDQPDNANGKKLSLLQRTWSSKRRKNLKSQDILEEDDLSKEKFQIEDGLADVVQEINATIGMMNEYTLLHHNHQPISDAEYGTAIPVPDNVQFRDLVCTWESPPEKNDFTNTNYPNHFQTQNCFETTDFEPNWECFNESPSAHESHEASDVSHRVSNGVENARFLLSLEANTQIISSTDAQTPSSTHYDIFEMTSSNPMHHHPVTSTLRRSGRRIYNTLRRKSTEKKVPKADNQFPDGISGTDTGSWMTRSFRKVVRRRQPKYNTTGCHDLRSRDSNNDISGVNQPNQESERKGMGKIFKKSLTAFGRSMMAVSSVMPVDFEHPSYPNDSSYPRAYYEEDEDAIYGFRRYCEDQEWNKY